MIGYYPYVVCIILMVLGIYLIMFQRNLIRIVIGLNIFEHGVNLYLITLGYREGALSPIFTLAPDTNMVLPTPQALTLTSIVIGFATTALMLSLIILVHRAYKTIDTVKIRGLKE